MRSFQELVAWQVGFSLAKATYQLTAVFPSTEAFGLTAQMRRAAISIPSNLAEGAGRGSSREFSHFVTIARGSLNELQTQYLLACDLGLCRRDEGYEADVERLHALLNGLRNSLNA